MLCMVKQWKTWGIELCKSKVELTLNKPAYDLYILDFSKLLLHKFHYYYIKNKYEVNSKLLFTDTDSLIYEMKTKDVFEDISKYEEMFGFRNFSSKSKYYRHSSKLVVGEVKDEVSGAAVKEFVGLKHRFIHSW